MEAVGTALAAGRVPEAVFVAAEAEGSGEVRAVAARALAAGSRVFTLAPGVAGRVADTVTPHPIFGVFAMTDVALRELARPTLAVACVDVRDPGNAGTVLRTCDAAGVEAVLFCGSTVDPYNPKTVRASAGSLFHVPLALAPDPLEAAADLAAAGFRTMATRVREGEDYAALDWSVPTALFLGNESSGLDDALCDALAGSLRIPMDGRAESLNVGVAAAVVSFEAFRQRRGGGPAPRSITGGGTTRHGD